MIAYASRTGNLKNLRAMKHAGWRILISPYDPSLPAGFDYGIDNGAWTSFQNGTPFDAARFESAIDRYGSAADWIVVPDIVEGGMQSLECSKSWLPRLKVLGRRLLVPVQDGMHPEDVAPILSAQVGIFVGGSTHFKERTAALWCELAHSWTGGWCHVGRVNSVRRIRICAAAGADSFDGSSASRYSVTLPSLDAARRVRDLFAPER